MHSLDRRHLRSLTKTACCGLLCFFALVALPAGAQSAQGETTLLQGTDTLAGTRLLGSGLQGDVQTVRGERYWLKQMSLSTPQDLAAAGPFEAAYAFAARPQPPEFSSIQKITFCEMTRTWQGSLPGSMEYYRLGRARSAVPPPPDWMEHIGQIPPWGHAVALGSVDHLPYLDHAVYCWTDLGERSQDDPYVYLFRQSFSIADPDQVACATLRLATNTEPVQMALNAHSIHLGGTDTFGLAEFEVTPLIKAGENILALMVRESAGPGGQSSGLAFHLELVMRPESVAVPPRAPDASLGAGESGDRVWGHVQSIMGDGMQIKTPFGLYGMQWEESAGLLLPRGWQPEQPRRSWWGALFGGGGAPPVAGEAHGLPLARRPQPIQDCLLLTDGRVTRAKPSYAKDGALYFEGIEGQQYSIPLAELLGIYPPRPVQWVFKRPEPHSALLYCRLTTTGGDRLSGLLRDLKDSSAVLETDQGEFLKIKSHWIASLEFPYHATRLPLEYASREAVGLVPQVSGQEAYQETYQEDARRVQAASFAIGTKSAYIPFEVLADSGRLRSDAWPVLVSVDPLGEYLDTLNQPGDARRALIGYLENGGVMIVLSRGGAFRTAVKNTEGRFIRTFTDPELSDKLGLVTIRPGEESAGTTAFDHPPNSNQSMYFQRSSRLPEGLLGLPRRVGLTPMMTAPFYPMQGRESQGIVLYDLCGENSLSCGPAMAIVPKGRGMMVIVDHLLWDSVDDGNPFADRVLPMLLHWALRSGER